MLIILCTLLFLVPVATFQIHGNVIQNLPNHYQKSNNISDSVAGRWKRYKNDNISFSHIPDEQLDSLEYTWIKPEVIHKLMFECIYVGVSDSFVEYFILDGRWADVQKHLCPLPTSSVIPSRGISTVPMDTEESMLPCGKKKMKMRTLRLSLHKQTDQCVLAIDNI